MANSNVNIGQRLFAYIEHGADVTSQITSQYNNSLLFIGDQQQIYVPAMGAYVGIGMSAYNDTIHGIKHVEDSLTTLAGTLTSALVSKIYPNFNPVSAKRIHDAANGGTGTGEVMVDDKIAYLTQSVTIVGIGDYDPTTHLAYTTFNIKNDTDSTDAAAYQYTVGKTNNGIYASSGITVNYAKIAEEKDPTTGAVTRPGENYLTIDDTLTWSYIASAYTYTMSWAQQYVEDEMERLYHNLLGDGDQYVHADEGYAFLTYISDNTGATTTKLNNAETFYYKAKVDESTAGAIRSEYTETKEVDGKNTVVSIYYVWKEYTYDSANPVPTDAIEGTAADVYSTGAPKLYYQSNEYDSTYNINITDGINTLKEVAYLFDVMTDGYGTPTYISKDVYDHLTDKTGYYLNMLATDSANTDEYAYYITYDAENLGIQMAYSLNSLKMEINDVHNQTGLLENGNTTLRSIVMEGSKFVTVSMAGSQNITPTDQNNVTDDTSYNYITYYWQTANGKSSGLGSIGDWVGNTYMSGDANINIQLKYTQTYLTSQITSIPSVWGNDYIVYNDYTYQTADMANLTATDNTYYTWNGTEMTAVAAADVNTDTHNNSSIHYYWVPSENAKYSTLINSTQKDIDWVYIVNNSSDAATDVWIEDLSNNTISKSNANAIFSAASTYNDSTKYRLFLVSNSESTILRPVLDMTDAIATAAWTTAYINAALNGVTNDLDNILDQANDYTDSKIEALDTDTLYDDFEDNVWNTYISASHAGASLVAGTTDYENAYDALYSYYIGKTTTAPNSDSAVVTASSIATSNVNRAKSGFVTSVTEEDGIVTTETREAPATYVAAHAETWGESNSSVYKRKYTKLVINSTSVDENGNLLPTDATTNAQKLWNFVHTKTYDNNIYVLSSEYDYEPVDTTEYSSYTTTTAYYYDQVTGTYKTVQEAIDAKYDWTFTLEGMEISSPEELTGSGNEGARKIQLYKQVPHYAECDLETIKWDNDTNPDNIIEVYAEGVEYKTSAGWDGKLYYVIGSSSDTETTSDPRKNNASNKYITANYEHYSYTTNNHGENNIDITIHLTHLEDATKANTGLADAYDVKKYVDNYFDWVNLSATIDESNISTNSVWYTEISYLVWDKDQTVTTYIWNGTEYTTHTPTADDWTQVDGVYVWKTDTHYYIKEQETFYNPLNLTLTKYISKVYDF